LFGGYGAYFGAAQLVETFAREGRGFTAGQAGAAALLIGLAGIPGSLVAGWLSDRLHRRQVVMLGMIAVEGIGLLLIPVATGAWIWLPAFLVGFAFNGCFAV
jgi:predicted MFS family arabinose efflux permease